MHIGPNDGRTQGPGGQVPIDRESQCSLHSFLRQMEPVSHLPPDKSKILTIDTNVAAFRRTVVEVDTICAIARD